MFKEDRLLDFTKIKDMIKENNFCDLITELNLEKQLKHHKSISMTTEEIYNLANMISSNSSNCSEASICFIMHMIANTCCTSYFFKV